MILSHMSKKLELEWETWMSYSECTTVILNETKEFHWWLEWQHSTKNNIFKAVQSEEKRQRRSVHVIPKISRPKFKTQPVGFSFFVDRNLFCYWNAQQMCNKSSNLLLPSQKVLSRFYNIQSGCPYTFTIHFILRTHVSSDFIHTTRQVFLIDMLCSGIQRKLFQHSNVKKIHTKHVDTFLHERR